MKRILVDDVKIIELFFERSEQAIAELSEKYGSVCRRLSMRILNNADDAQECVNDAYLGMWNTIPPNRPAPLLTFLLKIVRNISIARYHSNRAKKRNSYYDVSINELENCLSVSDCFDNISEKELTKIIEDFINTLSKENRVIFLRRYWFFDTYAEIAKKTNISEKNVSVRLTRIRKKLREFLFQKGIII